MWPHWILQSWSSAWKLTLYNINTTLKEPKRSNLLFLGGRRSFIDPICRSFLHGFAHISKVGFVHLCETSTWHLDSCPLGDTWYGVILWVFEFMSGLQNRVCGNFTVEPLCSLRHTDEPQKGQNSCLRLRTRYVLVLSVLCWCLTNLIFTLSKISFAEFSVSTQCIFLLVRSFIDPTFCGIFACGPLQYKCQFTCGRTLPSLPFSPRGRVQLHVGPLGCIHTLFTFLGGVT